VTAGWACWEIGAGGGSIASWLAKQVGPTGSVLATDIDPRFIPASELAHLEVVRHDVTADAIPEARYHLIHARGEARVVFGRGGSASARVMVVSMPTMVSAWGRQAG
jgi:precorrin-6B methylase 2